MSNHISVLITGSSGLLGASLCELLKSDYKITGGYYNNKPTIKGIDPIRFDISDKSSCKRILSKIKPDVILHCAAITNMDLCETDKKLAYDVNTYGTKNILESINKDCHFIFISTDNVYNNGKQFNRENAKKNITNVYGETKRKAEQIIKNSNCKHTILRTNIFGWHFAGRKTGLLNFIYENLKNHNEITLFHDVYFTPISIPNLINGLIEIINRCITGTFNYSGSERLSKLDFGLIVADVFKLDDNLINSISINEMNFKAKRPKEMSMSSSKISKYIKIPKKVHDQVIELGLPNY